MASKKTKKRPVAKKTTVKKELKPVTAKAHPTHRVTIGLTVFHYFYSADKLYKDNECIACLLGRCTKKVLFTGKEKDGTIILHDCARELNLP